MTAVGPATSTFRTHRLIKGKAGLQNIESIDAVVDTKLKPADLAILFGEVHDDETKWSATVANEAIIGYFFAAPSLRSSTVDRLRYFCKYLEHPDPVIAEDAYVEFANAPVDVVAQVAEDVSSPALRQWIKSGKVPETRKGLYGLLLGLVQPTQLRKENADFLCQEIDSPATDFRAGFDGILGGYLLLTGDAGLRHLQTKFLANSDSGVGDVRHAMTALRFYYEHGKEIAKSDLAAALAKVLERPEFAEAAIIDLARWQAWQFEEKIASLYDRPGYQTSEIKRAIVGYLSSSSERSAAAALASIRQKDPQGVAAAEEILRTYGALQSR